MIRKRSNLLAIAAGFAAMLFSVACGQSDAGITTKVKARLAADTTVKAIQINVDTNNGVVTLSGTVNNEAAKTQAVALARGTDGVADVVDNITVTVQPAQAQSGVGQALDDVTITAAVKSKLIADTVVGGLRIDVDTQRGVVSLSGPVKSQTERDTALRIARETSGVRDVQDKLVVQGG
jgi:osmotically-inducible protein OsmY